jgi:hypothetical protein
MFLSLAEFKKGRALKKERAFPRTPFRKKKLLNSKRESTWGPMVFEVASNWGAIGQYRTLRQHVPRAGKEET